MKHALPDYPDALTNALDGVRALNRFEPVTLDAALGRVTAVDVVADRDLPPFDRAQMDGYALRASEVGRQDAWSVVRTIAAGMPAGEEIPPGTCVAIATGAPLPPGADTVIQHELCEQGRITSGEASVSPSEVSFAVNSIEVGHAVHAFGIDARQGEVVIESGTLLRPHHLGIAASVGADAIEVHSLPRVIMLTSGDEVIDVDQTPLPHQIRNSNASLLRGLLTRMGADVVSAEHLIDEPNATNDAVRRAIDEADIVCTVGGVSAGERDYFPAAFEACGVEFSLHGAAIQPGKPVRVGRAPGGAVVIALPGNPVSVLACACLFAWPIIRVMGGRTSTLPWHEVTLGEAVKPNPRRRAFRPAILRNEATVPTWAGSGDLMHTNPTDGLLELPVQGDDIPAGTRLRFLPWP